MAAVLLGLSDEEIQRLCALPVSKKAHRFASAEKWLKQNSDSLRSRYPGKHVCIDAETLHYTVGSSHKLAAAQHKIGPKGKDFIFIWIAPTEYRPRA